MESASNAKSGWGWQQVSTAATITLFVIVGLTGLMLLFEWYGGFVRDVHSWLGLAFVLTGIVHTLRHWPSIRHYARGRLLWIMAIATIVGTLAFTVPAFNGGGVGQGKHHGGHSGSRSRN